MVRRRALRAVERHSNNRILRWDEESGRTTVFRKPSSYSNGNTRDRQGRSSPASTTRDG